MSTTYSTAFQEALDVHASLRRRVRDLQLHSIPQLRDCKGPLSFQQQLGAEVREDSDILVREHERLQTLVDDQESEKDRLKVEDWVEEMGILIQQVKKDARAALLTSKRTIDTSYKSYKDELLSSNAVASGSKAAAEKPPGEDALMKATNDVTEAFRRTANLMQQELERSVLTQQMFDESSRALTSTSDLYTAFGTLLNTSKTLITALERSDLLDRLLIASSLFLFLCVVAYILKKRIVDKGIGLAFWWLKYMPKPHPRRHIPIPVDGNGNGARFIAPVGPDRQEL